MDAKLATQRLAKNPPADARTLVRRIFLGSTWLPTTPRDMDAFVPEPDVAALAERLLASEHYGERWAQHWLDVIRWAETVGFETNAERKQAWPYRDWVIASLNENKPYDQFVFEQIAGENVGEAAALGFPVAGPANLRGQIGREEAAMRGARQDELDEVINTVSQDFLGLTLGCARCHDHKFGRVLQTGHYSMQAIFAGLQYVSRRWRGKSNDEMMAQVPKARDQVAKLQSELHKLREQLQLRPPLGNVHSEFFRPVNVPAIRIHIRATTNGAAASLYEFEVWSDAGDEPVNVALASQGATITASSFALANQSRHFDNLIDGSIDRRQSYTWISPNRQSSTD
ncbi:MAG: DUF1549 domain-containing protein [Pseudomonadota bacterium]